MNIESLIVEHVRADAGPLVDILSGHKGLPHHYGDLTTLVENAHALTAPVLDYESAARAAGWVVSDRPSVDGYWLFKKPGTTQRTVWKWQGQSIGKSWAELCAYDGIDPHERRPFAFHIVTPWLAERLEAKGERVARDFAGLIVWARAEIARPKFEVMFCDEDPDDEPGRAGRGWYFQMEGDETHNGAYDLEGEAMEYAADEANDRMRPALANDSVLLAIAAETPETPNAITARLVNALRAVLPHVASYREIKEDDAEDGDEHDKQKAAEIDAQEDEAYAAIRAAEGEA